MKINNALLNNASISNTHNKLKARQNQNVNQLALKNNTKQNKISNKENTQGILERIKLFTSNRAAEIQEFTKKESNFKNLYVKISDSKTVEPKLPDHSVNMTCSNKFTEDTMNIICNSGRCTMQKSYRNNQMFEQRLVVGNINSQSLINIINNPDNLKYPKAEKAPTLGAQRQQELEEYLPKYGTMQQNNGESPYSNIQDDIDIKQSQFKTPEGFTLNDTNLLYNVGSPNTVLFQSPEEISFSLTKALSDHITHELQCEEDMVFVNESISNEASANLESDEVLEFPSLAVINNVIMKENQSSFTNGASNSIGGDDIPETTSNQKSQGASAINPIYIIAGQDENTSSNLTNSNLQNQNSVIEPSPTSWRKDLSAQSQFKTPEGFALNDTNLLDIVGSPDKVLFQSSFTNGASNSIGGDDIPETTSNQKSQGASTINLMHIIDEQDENTSSNSTNSNLQYQNLVTEPSPTSWHKALSAYKANQTINDSTSQNSVEQNQL